MVTRLPPETTAEWCIVDQYPFSTYEVVVILVDGEIIYSVGVRFRGK